MGNSKWNARRRNLIRTGLVLGMTMSTSWAFAADPEKPIELIVPYPQAAREVSGRIVALKLGESLGQQVIVDKQGSADGNLAVEPAAKSPADGYTLLMAAFDKGKLHFNTLKDVTPLALVVKLQLPVKKPQQLTTCVKPAEQHFNLATSYRDSDAATTEHFVGALASGSDFDTNPRSNLRAPQLAEEIYARSPS